MKILLAVDGSEFSQAATQALVSQMRREGAEVLVLRVVESRAFFTPPQMAPGYAPEQVGIIKEDFLYAQESVDQASQALRSAGFTVNTRVVEAEARNGMILLRNGVPTWLYSVHTGERDFSDSCLGASQNSLPAMLTALYGSCGFRQSVDGAHTRF
jgi:hypothetical protein